MNGEPRSSFIFTTASSKASFAIIGTLCTAFYNQPERVSKCAFYNKPARVSKCTLSVKGMR